MEKSVIKYLADFSLKVEESYGDIIELRQLFEDADGGQLNIADDLTWIDDFKATLTCLQRILANEHLHVKFVKDLVKVQVASRLDQEGFAMTLRTPRVWKNTDKGLRPAEVYMNLYEDEYAIYENRFIKMVIDEMIRYLASILNELGDSLGNLRSYFGSKITPAGALRMQEEFTPETSDDKRILADDEDPIVTTYNEVETMLRKIKRCKSSRLYKACLQKPPIMGAIQPTNILTKDFSYRQCFLFYKRLGKMRNHEENVIPALHTNGVLRLLYALHRNGYHLVRSSVAMKAADDSYTVKNVLMQNEHFNIEISSISKDELLFKTTMRQQEHEKDSREAISPRYTSSVLVKFSDCTAEESGELERQYRQEKLMKGYDDVYLAVYSRKRAKSEGVLNFANRGDFNCRVSEDFVRSLTMVLVGSHKIFERRCPVCGTRFAGSEEEVHNCITCDSVWSLVKEKDVEKVWVKRVRN